ncbi:MAG TPA: rRNA adenine N-6-methyltransferase family protein [Chthoniobacterales bacterium]|jgi:phospholipid N-methyltransferase
MQFFKEALFAPHTTGAIAPSSKHLARVIVEKAGVTDAERILEIGPGTGAFTGHILKQKKRDAHFVAIERNPNFATDLKGRFPHARIVEGCATELRDHATAHAFTEADSIVSGLPWTIFDPKLQYTILGGIHDVLGKGGTFATFAYFGSHWMPGGQNFRNLLRSVFPNTRTSNVVLRNLPPAFVYYCRK